MKLAAGANSRVQARERQRRERDAAPALRILYLQFSTLRVELEFATAGPFTPAPQALVMHPPAHAYFMFRCPHQDCGGVFDLTAAIAEMALAGRMECEGKRDCQGHRSGDGEHRATCAVGMKFHVRAVSG